ncbi:MAG TPA: hypothetical protein VKX49_12925 [Bryobacteraceae bacterium]|nr:hypothetical protein [Bryobacteraceae bacterium]
MNSAARSFGSTGRKCRAFETSQKSKGGSLNGSISSAADSPLRTSRKPENAQASKDLARAFGLSSPALLGFFDPDTFLLKTSQVCLITGQCQELSENWPDSGMWDLGSAYELHSSERAISENESSSWPTTRASSGGGNRSAYPGAPYRPALTQIAQNWPTPRGEDGESCGNHPNSQGDSLTGATKLWRTPDAAGDGGPRNRHGSIGDGHQVTIAEQAEHWATPNAHDGTGARGKNFELTDCHYKPHDLVSQTDSWKTPHGMSNRDHRGKVGGCGGGEFAKQANQWQTPATDSFRSRGGDRKDEMGLDQQARMFPTPSARDYRTPNKSSYQDRAIQRRANS